MTLPVHLRSFVLLIVFAAQLFAADATVDPQRIRADMEFLASDAMQGRKSASDFEAVAAAYIASRLLEAGVQPAGDRGGYVQQFSIPVQVVKAPPVLRAGKSNWLHGKDVAFGILAEARITAPLQRASTTGAVKAGSAVLVLLRQDKDAPAVRDQILGPLRAGAAVVLVGYSEQLQQRFASAAKDLPDFTPAGRTYILLGPKATDELRATAEGTTIQVEAAIEERNPIRTRNVIGVLPGTTDEVVLLSAHLDHIGTKTGTGDTIFNGADDDASGCTAVLELARALAMTKDRRRTVYFLFTGSEELGLLGGTYFLEHPPVSFEKIVANLEFEMIGRPDPAIAPRTLWMTGFDRSDLGPELAKHGARVVADPHPEQQFFTRSDNFPLAKKGVIAHGVSSFGLHAQYHQPDDDIAHIDFAHMTEAIQSLLSPVKWLVESDFKPQWVPGKKP